MFAGPLAFLARTGTTIAGLSGKESIVEKTID
jgi:hypothetical protein